MNEKINLDLKSLKFIFEKNKPYIFPGVVILACIILFFQFIIPQFNALLKTNQEARSASLELETLTEDLNILSNVDEKSLDSQSEIANRA